MAARIPIYHVASFSRSGETLLLRTLAVHSRVAVVHNLFEPDAPEDLELASHLMGWSRPCLPGDHRLLTHRDLGPKSVLVLKNAVWEHASPFRGVILVRNPFSVIYSTGVTKEPQPPRRREKIERWCFGIDPGMYGYLSTQDNLTAFCMLYARKMAALHATGLPIVHYERFVGTPGVLLRKIVRHLALGWEPALLNAHTHYRAGLRGHGRIDLSAPIHRQALAKYKDLPEATLNKIYALTSVVFRLYGYEIASDLSVCVRDGFNDRFRRPAEGRPGRRRPGPGSGAGANGPRSGRLPSE